jgi:hypothetical protein
MSVFRNVLTVCGAVWCAEEVVNFTRWGLLRPITGLGGGFSTPGAAYGWAIGFALVFGVLSGAVGAVGVNVDRDGWWPFVMFVTAWLGAPAGISRHPFSDALSYAMAVFVASAIGAICALVSFVVGRWYLRRGRVVASAR